MTEAESTGKQANGTINKALDNSKELSSVKSAIAQATIPQWLNLTLMLSLIFGGCCSNVLALEALIREVPGSGTLITFTQFLLTALLTLPSYLEPSRGLRNLYLRPRAIPLQRWIIYTLFFVTINLLNNKAFNYQISLPLHVILRSAGPVTSMFVGYLYGKRYTKTQICAVFLLFLGVVLAAISDARAKGKTVTLTTVPSSSSSSSSFTSPPRSQTIGFALLFLALLLSALQGQYTDRLYTTFGRAHWNENIFYSHVLPLPVFLLDYAALQFDFSKLITTSPPVSTLVNLPALPFPSNSTDPSAFIPILTPALAMLNHIPLHPVLLLANALTQYLCIRGVNLLSAQSSSLTVTIVLNVRKLVSLVLSIVMFGNRVPFGVVVGAACVFGGMGLYAMPTGPGAREQKKKELEEEGGEGSARRRRGKGRGGRGAETGGDREKKRN